jgi:hypothetical protein
MVDGLSRKIKSIFSFCRNTPRISALKSREGKQSSSTDSLKSYIKERLISAAATIKSYKTGLKTTSKKSSLS